MPLRFLQIPGWPLFKDQAWRTYGRTLLALACLVMGSIWAGWQGLHLWHARGEAQGWVFAWLWLALSAGLLLLGAWLVVRLVYQPLQQLRQAMQRMRDGDFGSGHLPETEGSPQVRDVNRGFNRIARRLARLEEERAVMLAGISHDLRTPLARLRLEAEISVSDDVARQHMVADIVQLDATIDKFLDYARPDHVRLSAVNLRQVVAQCVYAVPQRDELQIALNMQADLLILADEVELVRIISNLIENARRYGKTPQSEICFLTVHAEPEGPDLICLRMRDQGFGVPAEQLERLTEPFFRSDRARTAAAGAGLGLSIVQKTVRRMGGSFTLRNAHGGGLEAEVCLRRAPEQTPEAEQRLQRPQTQRAAEA